VTHEDAATLKPHTDVFWIAHASGQSTVFPARTVERTSEPAIWVTVYVPLEPMNRDVLIKNLFVSRVEAEEECNRRNVLRALGGRT
jgi:hypothetical protein